ncbi:hypothetical protein F511_30150 [Dorcoceras hygrometricum]|uniref:Retrotransposon gag domain-containing protein n=1 Tax=Dorcoceras hygrometricum TaxID=472368 RepID=A0A2Z7A8Y4_9LAMI|nr:hypothetical protein F511_30150 [Dorcoceras hygrometricum]
MVEEVEPTMTANGQITWQRFWEAFLKQYFPMEVRMQRLSEFETFTQTADMSVVEYTSKFNSLGTLVEEVEPTMTANGQITWQRFWEAFLKQYFPMEVRMQRLSEFETFTQTADMSVVEYTSKFNSLGTFVPTIMADNTPKMHRLNKGLNSRI